MSKSCDITIEFKGWKTEDIILKLAEYIKDGFRVNTMHYEHAYNRYETNITVELTQYN